MPVLVPTRSPIVLLESEWCARAAAHESRVRAWTDPHQARAGRGEKHPVYDFLFTYYAFRPAWLRRWHPGPDVALGVAGVADPGKTDRHNVQVRGQRPRLQSDPTTVSELGAAREFLRRPEYREIALDDGTRAIAIEPAALPPHRREFVRWLRAMLGAMQERPAFFGCYGLHEWAMAYRQTPAETRHNAWPLRFAADDLARIVEGSAVCCSHFDAFRFFTAPARPLNKLQPTRADSAQLEQRGCLHANMDLYKWAFKLAPFTPAELIADCFELARDIREVDMRASPYDLRTLGFAPITIETPTGRAEYEQHQRAFAVRGEPLRARLIKLCARLLDALPTLELPKQV